MREKNCGWGGLKTREDTCVSITFGTHKTTRPFFVAPLSPFFLAKKKKKHKNHHKRRNTHHFHADQGVRILQKLFFFFFFFFFSLTRRVLVLVRLSTMKLLFVLVLVLLVSVGVQGAVLEYSEGLGYDDIKKPNFFFFFHPSCELSNCQEVLNILVELSASDLHTDVAFIHVDKNKFSGVADEFHADKIASFSFKLVQNEKVFTYSGAPLKESISAFLQAPKGGSFPLPPALRRVTALTDDTFQKDLTVGDWFLFVYVPWSGRCRKMQSVMNKIARDSRLPYELKIGKIDLLEEIEFLHQFQIDRIEDHFPLFYRLRDGKYEHYNGTLDKEEIVTYLVNTEEIQKTFKHKFPPQLGMFDHFWYGAEDYFHGPTPFVVCTFVSFLGGYLYFVLRSSKKGETGATPTKKV